MRLPVPTFRFVEVRARVPVWAVAARMAVALILALSLGGALTLWLYSLKPQPVGSPVASIEVPKRQDKLPDPEREPAFVFTPLPVPYGETVTRPPAAVAAEALQDAQANPAAPEVAPPPTPAPKRKPKKVIHEQRDNP